jgi:hypothetical protein
LERLAQTENNKPGAQASRIKKFNRAMDLLNRDLDIVFRQICITDIFLVFGSSLISAKEIYVWL